MNNTPPRPLYRSRESQVSDGFTILPDGNILINDGNGSPVYRKYYSTGNSAGQPTGMVIDLSTYITPPDGLSPAATGVATAPDGTLYFVAGGSYISGLVANTLIHWDLTQGKLGAQIIPVDGIEDIDVLILQ